MQISPVTGSYLLLFLSHGALSRFFSFPLPWLHCPLCFKGTPYLGGNFFWFCVGLGLGWEWEVCFLLNCPIYFGKQKLHCFVNCTNGFLHVQIRVIWGGGFNEPRP